MQLRLLRMFNEQQTIAKPIQNSSIGTINGKVYCIENAFRSNDLLEHLHKNVRDKNIARTEQLRVMR